MVALSGSLKDTRDIDPYPLYEELRQQGSVVWDDGMDAWLVLDHDGCTLVERCEDLFAETTGSLPGADVITGRRDLRALVGAEHDTLHRSLSHEWRPKPLAPYGAEVIRPVIADGLAALAGDDATLRQAKGWLEAVLAWRHTYGADDEVREAAIEATRHISPMLLDVIRERRDRPSRDMVSWLWSAGLEVADDWGEDDVLANATFLFEAGSETTSLLICTLVKRLLEESAERRDAVLADPESLRWYTDEVLRDTTVVQWRARRATQDVEVGGVTIRAGDMVRPVNAAANRDPVQWERPAEFVPRRPRLAGHLAFNVGPRHCAGAHLARLETSEIVRALFSVFPDVALDPDAPSPVLTGYVSRAWRPLHLRHAPRDADAVRDEALDLSDLPGTRNLGLESPG